MGGVTESTGARTGGIESVVYPWTQPFTSTAIQLYLRTPELGDAMVISNPVFERRVT